MNIVKDGNDYEQQQISTWRLRELLQHEKVVARVEALADEWEREITELNGVRFQCAKELRAALAEQAHG